MVGKRYILSAIIVVVAVTIYFVFFSLPSCPASKYNADCRILVQGCEAWNNTGYAAQNISPLAQGLISNNANMLRTVASSIPTDPQDMVYLNRLNDDFQNVFAQLALAGYASGAEPSSDTEDIIKFACVQLIKMRNPCTFGCM